MGGTIDFSGLPQPVLHHHASLSLSVVAVPSTWFNPSALEAFAQDHLTAKHHVRVSQFGHPGFGPVPDSPLPFTELRLYYAVVGGWKDDHRRRWARLLPVLDRFKKVSLPTEAFRRRVLCGHTDRVGSQTCDWDKDVARRVCAEELQRLREDPTYNGGLPDVRRPWYVEVSS